MNRLIFMTLIKFRRTSLCCNDYFHSVTHQSYDFKDYLKRTFSTTSYLHKIRPQKISHPVAVSSNDKLLFDAYKEFEDIKERLIEEFNRHFSLRTDLRIYEECKVKLDNNEMRNMNQLARVTMRNPKTVAINFDDNPSVIKLARLALQNSAICSNPQQEGTTIYIPIPESTRELREKIADKSRFILNDYKKALNATFSKYSDKNNNEKVKDQQIKRRNEMLALKRQYDTFGEQLMKDKRVALMKEIA